MDDTLSDLATAWHGVVADLQPNQRAWLRASEPITLHGHTAIIAVPNDFTRHQLEGRLRAQLEDALSVRPGDPDRGDREPGTGGRTDHHRRHVDL